MHTFCKAYLLKDVRKFSGWLGKRPSNEEEITDETICFIWNDFTVVKDPVYDRDILFDEVTPEWMGFCQTTLHFEIPKEML